MNFLLKHRAAALLIVAIVLPIVMQVALGGATAYAICDPTKGECKDNDFSPVKSVAELIAKFGSIVNIIFTGLLLTAIVFILLAAFDYLTAGGDAEKVKKASHRVLYAAIAVAVAVFARAVPLVVQSFLLGGGGGATPTP